MHSGSPAPASPFPPTRWSALEGARTLNEDRRLQALEAFLHTYYGPLQNYVMHQHRLDPDRARDCLHEFILNRLIRKNLLIQADRTRGRLRTFLAQALNRFIIDEMRKGKAARRSPGQPLAALEDLAEGALDHLSASAQAQFDLDFARGVVHEALLRMWDRCEATNRKDLWRLFHSRVLEEAFESRRPLPYAQLAPLLNLRSEAQAANLLATAKRMFARVFEGVVKDYEADEQAREAEKLSLRHILSNAPG